MDIAFRRLKGKHCFGWGTSWPSALDLALERLVSMCRDQGRNTLLDYVELDGRDIGTVYSTGGTQTL